jgi:hypothetical protein
LPPVVLSHAEEAAPDEGEQKVRDVVVELVLDLPLVSTRQVAGPPWWVQVSLGRIRVRPGPRRG